MDGAGSGHQRGGHGSGDGAELCPSHHDGQGGVGDDLRGFHRKFLVGVFLFNLQLGGGLVVLQLLDPFLVAGGGLYLGVVLGFHVVDFYLLEGVEGRADAAQDGVCEGLHQLAEIFDEIL